MSWEICPKCGFRTIKEGERCFKCGFVYDICPKCGYETYLEGTPCRHCGFRTDLKKCPDCDKLILETKKFCPNCGSDFKYKTCPICGAKQKNITNTCSKCNFGFQKEEIFTNVIKSIDELKQLLDSDLISTDQFRARILKMIKQRVVMKLTLVEAKYFLGLIKPYEKEAVIERSTYDKISDYILENCFHVPDSIKDNKKDPKKEQQIKPDIDKLGPVERNNFPSKDKTIDNSGSSKGIGLKITLTAVTILIGGIVAGIIDETVGFGRGLTAGVSVLIIIWIWKR